MKKLKDDPVLKALDLEERKLEEIKVEELNSELLKAQVRRLKALKVEALEWKTFTTFQLDEVQSSHLYMCAFEMGLSKTETVIFLFLFQFTKHCEIAEAMCVGEKTIKWHATNIYSKFEVTCKTMLILKVLLNYTKREWDYGKNNKHEEEG